MRKIQKERFADCVARHRQLIFNICLSFTKNYFDAEDLTQETFLSAYSHLKAFDGSNERAWLTTIAANKCRDFLKSPARNTDSLTQEDLSCLESGWDLPEEKLMQKDASQRVHNLCEKLKEPYRATAISYFCNNEKLSELSRDTGKNLKTLETQLYRAKKLLKALWKEEPV